MLWETLTVKRPHFFVIILNLIFTPFIGLKIFEFLALKKFSSERPISKISDFAKKKFLFFRCDFDKSDLI